MYVSQLQNQDSGYKGAKPIDPWASGILSLILINVVSKSVFPEADSADQSTLITNGTKKNNVSHGQRTLGITAYNISAL